MAGGAQLGGQARTFHLFLADVVQGALVPQRWKPGTFQGRASAPRAREAGGKSTTKWSLLLHVHKSPFGPTVYPRKRWQR